MTEELTPAEPSPIRKLFGGLLLALGILIAALSGLCTLAGVVLFGAGGSGNAGNALLALIIGAPPLLIGAGLIWWGRYLLRRPSPKT